MKLLDLPEIKELSVLEKIQFVEDLWDEISEKADIPLTQNQKDILDNRYQEMIKDPESGLSWKDVRKRTLNK